MSLTQQINCLKEKGLISSSQATRINQIATSLPESDAELSRLIAASLLASNNNEVLLESDPIGTQSITSTGTGDVKTLTVPAGAVKAIVSVHLNNIIFRSDAGTPTTTAGHFAEKNKNFTVGNLGDFKFISDVAGNATIFVSYY